MELKEDHTHECLACSHTMSRYTNRHNPVVQHYYRRHLSITEAPYYCPLLCDVVNCYKSQLDDHVKSKNHQKHASYRDVVTNPSPYPIWKMRIGRLSRTPKPEDMLSSAKEADELAYLRSEVARLRGLVPNTAEDPIGDDSQYDFQVDLEDDHPEAPQSILDQAVNKELGGQEGLAQAVQQDPPDDKDVVLQPVTSPSKLTAPEMKKATEELKGSAPLINVILIEDTPPQMPSIPEPEPAVSTAMEPGDPPVSSPEPTVPQTSTSSTVTITKPTTPEHAAISVPSPSQAQITHPVALTTLDPLPSSSTTSEAAVSSTLKSTASKSTEPSPKPSKAMKAPPIPKSSTIRSIKSKPTSSTHMSGKNNTSQKPVQTKRKASDDGPTVVPKKMPCTKKGNTDDPRKDQGIYSSTPKPQLAFPSGWSQPCSALAKAVEKLPFISVDLDKDWNEPVSPIRDFGDASPLPRPPPKAPTAEDVVKASMGLMEALIKDAIKKEPVAGEVALMSVAHQLTALNTNISTLCNRVQEKDQVRDGLREAGDRLVRHCGGIESVMRAYTREMTAQKDIFNSLVWEMLDTQQTLITVLKEQTAALKEAINRN